MELNPVLKGASLLVLNYLSCIYLVHLIQIAFKLLVCFDNSLNLNYFVSSAA